MIIFLKISLISTIITLAAAAAMFYFTRYDFTFKETYNEGLDLYRMKQYKAALSKFQLAIMKFPDKYQSYYNAGLCELQLKAFDKAKNYFLETLKFCPDDVDTIYNLGYVEFAQDNFPKAKEYFEQVKDKISQDSDLIYSLGYIALQEGDNDKAIELIKKAIDISPEKTVYKKKYQDLLDIRFQETGDMKIQQEILNLSLELLVIYPNDEDVIYRAAVAYAQMGDWGNSINYCERLFNINSNSYKALNQYGLALFCKGEMNDAIEMYEKSIMIAPNVPDSYMNLVFAYDKIGDWENAITLANDFLAKFPDDPAAELAQDFIARKGKA